jgi:hypothetical protein
MTRRGKVLAAGVTTVVLAAGAVGTLALTGNAAKIPLIDHIPGLSSLARQKAEKPPTCPLTGVAPHHAVPDRPALAIKVENLPEARPQAGLERADVVYEEPVEGGITRFIVVYQCQDAKRVGPVRSARLTDPDVLIQFGTSTLFGYAGGVPRVEKAVADRGLHDVNYDEQAAIKAQAYERDPDRSEPHNLYTSTGALYRAGHEKDGKPAPVFSYRKKPPAGAASSPAHTVHLDWSSTSNVFWTWNPKRAVWLRSYDTGPAMLEGDRQIAATNVVVQVVKVEDTGIVDVIGTPSPEAVTVGTGKAYVFRDGRVVEGTWKRPSVHALTRFFDSSGKRIPLAPGTTWVELLPDTVPVEISR